MYLMVSVAESFRVSELLDSSIAVAVIKRRTLQSPLYPFGHAFIQDLSRILLGS